MAVGGIVLGLIEAYVQGFWDARWTTTVVFSVLIAILVQPTVAALSDHTSSPLGRRKPYIVFGSLLDLVFLAGIALANNVVILGAFGGGMANAIVGTLMFSLLVQLVGILPGLSGLHPYLLSTQFNAWQGLLRTPADW